MGFKLLMRNRAVGFKPTLFACIAHILALHTLPPIYKNSCIFYSLRNTIIFIQYF